ncbi:hypothetical protein AWB85_16845 [Mycobacteroides immunogenum]|uniref:Lipoprotein n=1 Tax=Mycobacteroides immunogenum TaxID=83262 RepID=A0A179V423_9MYCO|nr:hypothetical protein [Mycobacteroides immunogenum]OAT66397.1 hypothetical protein AWB85_16845 [Mycobacteroides immunogenum]
MSIKSLVITLSAALLASGCVFGTTKQGAPVTGPTVNEQGFSLLTEAGIDEIIRTKRGRFDLRSGDLSKAAVGLENSDKEPMIGRPGGEEVTFTFLGPAAEETLITDSITFTTSNITNSVDNIVWFSAPANMDAAHAELRSGIYRWGFRPQDVERWINDSAKHETDKSTLGMGVGLAGLVVEVTARKKNGNEIYQYSIYLGGDYYTPKVQETIHATGKSH